MRTRIFYIIVFLSIVSIRSYAQNSEQNAKQTVEQLSERMLLTDPKRDSLTMVFKSYFDDVKIYKGKGPKMLHALQLSRDTEVGRILNENQYKEYQNYIEELNLHAIRTKKGKEYGKH